MPSSHVVLVFEAKAKTKAEVKAEVEAVHSGMGMNTLDV